ncbi:MAG: penicillin-binding transpeptidase domain-containing protein [Clostridia bacterium]|nr:penicillin-binding transpeptidase domain-containing protein [Clostridia bacterium]
MRYNNRIITLMVAICVLFLSLAVYLTYYTLAEAPKVVQSSYNRRLFEAEDKVIRGSVTDRSGTVLAKSFMEDGKQVREYTQGGLYTHTIGYSSRNYGKSALELRYNKELLYTDVVSEVFSPDVKQTGATLRLSADNEMTKKAASLLRGRNGSVIAIGVKTGEILCMYSNPTFDPNESKLADEWANLADDDDSPFVARATSGLYAPGSTFKTVIAAAAAENGLADFSMEDTGVVRIDGKDFKNSGEHVYGSIDLKSGFAKSSNVMFATLGVQLGESVLRDVVSRFWIGNEIEFDISTSKSRFPYDTAMSRTDMASVGIGQGKLLVTPLNMALIAQSIANGGVMMKPYLVESATLSSGGILYRARPQALTTVCSAAAADKVGELMRECVVSGTGARAALSGTAVAGKTGTAENERADKEHAWFIGYAPYENPTVAVAVMCEYSGSGGGSVCAPIAREILRMGLKILSE